MVGDQLSQSNQANLAAMNATIQTTPNARLERSIPLGSARQHPAKASVVQAMKTPKPIWAVVRQKYPKSKQRINLSRLITRSGFTHERGRERHEQGRGKHDPVDKVPSIDLNHPHLRVAVPDSDNSDRHRRDQKHELAQARS
jgi:hypothetical protein